MARPLGHPRNSKSSEGPQPAKHRRLLQKQAAPLPCVLQDDLVDRAMDPERLGNRVLINQSIGHKQNINAWVKLLKQTIGESKRHELMQATARAPEILKTLP